MPVTRRLVLLAASGLLLMAVQVPGGQAIAFDDPHLRLGKLDPGHQSVHQRNVTNAHPEAVDVEVSVDCSCPVYLAVSPTSFTLRPGERETLTITVDVPAEAEPGIHDNRIRVTERGANGAGVTPVASATIDASFQVRAAAFYVDPFAGNETLTARFVNAYDEDVLVSITGTLTGPDIERVFMGIGIPARGSAEGARTTPISLDLPFEDADPSGIYRAALIAEWHNATTGRSGSSGPHVIDLVHGTIVRLVAFSTTPTPDGLQLTGTLRSLSAETLEAWLVVGTTPAGGDAVMTTSDKIALAAGEEQMVSVHWKPPQTGTYSIEAYALYSTAGGTEGRSDPWPSEERSFQPGSAHEDDGPGDGGASSITPTPAGSRLLAILALVGLGVGATLAIVVNRRGDRGA